MSASVKIIPYQPSLKKNFYDINKEWISTMFKMEPIDEEVLSQPEKYILATGGYIWFAMHDQLGPIGVAALMNTGKGQFELTKMGVLAKAQGLKAGDKLLSHILDFVKHPDSGVNYCYLLTNAKCKAAIHLYKKHGFLHDQMVMQNFGNSYERANVAMRLKMSKQPKKSPVATILPILK